MNLSQRLDKARESRSDSDDKVSYLRLSRDTKTYDGTDLKTGHALTSDAWEGKTEDESLPSWRPDRAHETSSIDWRIDFSGPTTNLDAPTKQQDRPTAQCRSCVGTATVYELDLLENVAKLRCGQCGVEWTDVGMNYAPKAR